MIGEFDLRGEDLETQYQRLVAEDLKVDEELEGLKTELQRSPSEPLTVNRRTAELIEKARSKARSRVQSKAQSTSTLDDLEAALEGSIRELREAVNTIASVQYNIEGQCQQSKAKAVESHKEAQASLLDHNMTGVFLHSANKTAHIKVVQILREQASHAESKAGSLRKSLANLEKLKNQFQTQAKLVNFQASNPSPQQQVVQSPPESLEDYELVNLKKQLDDL
jgi:hypothetical protein